MVHYEDGQRGCDRYSVPESWVIGSFISQINEIDSRDSYLVFNASQPLGYVGIKGGHASIKRSHTIVECRQAVIECRQALAKIRVQCLDCCQDSLTTRNCRNIANKCELLTHSLKPLSHLL
jgi:hypothetical protein